MNVVLLVAGLGLVALPGWTSRLGSRLPPHEWARLSFVSLWTGLVAVRVGLVVTAVPTILHVVGVHTLVEVCHQTLGSIPAGGAAAAVASATVLLLFEVRIVRARRHARETRRRLHVEPWLGRHVALADHELVVVPTGSSLAYAVAGPPPQVVLSNGLAAWLSDDELSAVISHEQCHLRCNHHRYLELAQVMEAAFRPVGAVRRSAATLRLAVERWADESAAEHSSRPALRAALEKVVGAMLGPTGHGAAEPGSLGRAGAAPAPAFTSGETIRARLEALDAAPLITTARWRLAAVAPVATLAVAIATVVVHGSNPTHHVLLANFGCCAL